MISEPFNLCFLLHVDYNYIDELEKNDFSSIYGSIFFTLHDLLPTLPLSLAVSGSFIEWAKTSNSPFIYWIRDMTHREQVELIGGAFYEPFFSLIPPNDLLSQIEELNKTFSSEFKKKSRGCYVPLSAWSEGVIAPLKKGGMSYCILDSTLFKKASLCPYEPSAIEDCGKTIFALPLEYSLSNIDNMSPKEFWECIARLASRGYSSLIVPLTKKVLNACLLERGGTSWFKEFLSIIKSSNVKITHIGKIIKTKKVYQRGIISSNAVLNGEPLNSSIKKLIFAEPTLSSLYCKMQYVHSLCNQVRGDKARKNAALEDLWKAESAVCFNLEKPDSESSHLLIQYAYRHLLLAEKQARTPGVFSTSLLTHDFNMDGVEEFLFQNNNINMYVSNIGGKVFEMDVFSIYKNYTYMSGELGLFLDHLVSKDDIAKIANKDYTPIRKASIFANNFYQNVKQNKLKMDLWFCTDSVLASLNASVSLKKRYKMTEDGMQVQYILKNDSTTENLQSNFMVELSLALDVEAKKTNLIYAHIYAEDVMRELSIKDIVMCPTFLSVAWVQLEYADAKTKFMMELNEESSVMLLPVYKKCLEPKNKNIIGLRLLFYWNVELKPGYNTEKMLFFKLLGDKKKRR